jgi:hypothetical protein
MKILKILTIPLLILSSLVSAEGPSTAESVGMIDGFIQICRKANPAKAEQYEAMILKAHNCSLDMAEQKNLFQSIRENKRAEIKQDYQNSFDRTVAEVGAMPKKETIDFCESMKDIKC